MFFILTVAWKLCSCRTYKQLGRISRYIEILV